MAAPQMKGIDNESQWPVKTGDRLDSHTDTRIWADFKFRADDVFIATWAKSGTTWTQQIVNQLLSNGDANSLIRDNSPWVDFRIVPREAMLGMIEAQTQRRNLKTHAPINTIVYSPQAKYIYIARDTRDAMWSLWNHMYNATPFFYEIINNTPGRVGPALERPPADQRKFFLDFLDDDDSETNHTIVQPYWSYMRGWYQARHLPNVLLLHYNDMKADMEGEIRRIAGFLDVRPTDDAWPRIFEHCTFEYMKANAELMSPPQSDAAFEGGAQTFINKGTNGRWKDVLTDEDNKRFEEKIRAELGDDCAAWVMYGRKKA